MATTEATAQNAPVAGALRPRAANTSAKEEPSAAITWPAAKTTKVGTGVERRGGRSVASPVTGAPTTMPTAAAAAAQGPTVRERSPWRHRRRSRSRRTTGAHA
ncbi:hypothetical protein [Streptomyces sp. NPDC016172]|uniref:hypothetical protein n=1 Tax=Streptomyces sp. NPDC016172 TaxID=3364964 RepID=UPI00370250C3